MSVTEYLPTTTVLSSSGATLGSTIVWGITQEEWAIYMGMGSAVVAVLSLSIQLWLSVQKARLFRAQLRALSKEIRSDG